MHKTDRRYAPFGNTALIIAFIGIVLIHCTVVPGRAEAASADQDKGAQSSAPTGSGAGFPPSPLPVRRLDYSFPFSQSLLGKLEDSPGPIVIEHFSARNCVFCPKADKLFADLVRKSPAVIGLACHVDYFTGRGAHSADPLAREFCTRRQTRYIQALPGAMRFTPQMIINGRRDVTGYKFDAVGQSLKEVAAGSDLQPIRITLKPHTDSQSGNGQSPAEATAFQVRLRVPESTHPFTTADADDGGGETTGSLWLAMFDRPHKARLQEGVNAGMDVRYINIVSSLQKLGPWNGKAKQVSFDLDIRDHHKGLAVLAHDPQMHIVAAAHYHFEPQDGPLDAPQNEPALAE